MATIWLKINALCLTSTHIYVFVNPGIVFILLSVPSQHSLLSPYYKGLPFFYYKAVCDQRNIVWMPYPAF